MIGRMKVHGTLGDINKAPIINVIVKQAEEIEKIKEDVNLSRNGIDAVGEMMLQVFQELDKIKEAQNNTGIINKIRNFLKKKS